MVEALYVVRVPNQLPLGAGLEEEEQVGLSVLESAKVPCRVVIETRRPTAGARASRPPHDRVPVMRRGRHMLAVAPACCLWWPWRSGSQPRRRPGNVDPRRASWYSSPGSTVLRHSALRRARARARRARPGGSPVVLRRR